MSLESRLAKLEEKIGPPEERHPRTDAEFLEYYTYWGEQGFYDGEPEYSEALEALQQAMTGATGTLHGFLMWDNLDYQGRKERDRRLRDARNWLHSMTLRVCEREPPLTRVGYDELIAWYQEHIDAVPSTFFVPREWRDDGREWLSVADAVAEGYFADELHWLVKVIRQSRSSINVTTNQN